MAEDTQEKLQETVAIADVVELRENGKSFVMEEIKGGGEAKGEGLKFAVPQFTTVQGIVDNVSAKNIISIVNQILKRAIKQKITHSLPSGVDDSVAIAEIRKRLEGKPEGILFTIDEADEYQYNVKEPSIANRMKQIATDLTSGEIDADGAVALLRKLGLTK